MLSNLEIARSAHVRPIAEVADDLGLSPDEIEPQGRFLAKVHLDPRLVTRRTVDGRLILVTAITPTPAGEGKTTTSVGLAQALNRLGVRAAVALRQPSLGPVFGLRGGAAGGGYSQVVPMDALNLHLTGDTHAVVAAHNLAAAFLDNHLHHGTEPRIDSRSVTWPRVVDVNDRALTKVAIGLGGVEGGVPREAEWVIAAASEVMAVLGLSDDLADVRARLARIVVARGHGGALFTLEDLRVAGAMTVLLRDALHPNLLQTLEGGPAFVHTGAFAHIAHGSSSVASARLALRLLDAVVTESGFGADLGAEKFFDIVCRQSGLRPSACVLVATVPSLAVHGGHSTMPLDASSESRAAKGAQTDVPVDAARLAAVRRGVANLAKHVENLVAFGVPVVVAINAHARDAPAEHDVVREAALAAGARAAIVARHHDLGGEGALELAEAVWTAATGEEQPLRLLYADDLPLAKKVEAVATRIYGADGIDVSARAARDLAELEQLGYGSLPVCIAKTPYSLSHLPERKGRPTGFRLPVAEARLAAGAGFVTVFSGNVRLMAGLPEHPAGESIDIDAEGNVVGLA
jgi:formate--tetrahydrofolate ligase